MKIIHGIAFGLVIIGALNWLLVGLGDWNLVKMILGQWMVVEKVVYVLVGVSGLILVFSHKKDCKMCECGTEKTPVV